MAVSFTAGGTADQLPDRGTGDHGEIWNPTGGPNGTGAWEAPPAAPTGPSRQFTPGAWGGQGNDLMPDGTEVQGTSGAARDVNRYRGMAGPQYANGPQIDQTQSGESRGLSMGSLGLLADTASGVRPSAAEQLGTQMGQRAQNAGYSLGASVRGGAMARAAAGRNATMGAGVIDAQTRQGNAATRAGEMAGARDAYFGAASGQRGEDLGLATSQAGLEAGQRGANDSREGFYEGLGQNTKNAELGHQLGRTAQDQNAASANAAQALANSTAKDARTEQAVAGATGAISGGAAAYLKTDAPSNDPDPDTTGSDERMKTNVDDMLAPPPPAAAPRKPISDKEAARLRKAAEKIGSGTDAQREAAGLSTTNTPGNESAARGEAEPARARVQERARQMSDDANPYDRSMYSKSDDGTVANTAALHAGIEEQIAKDAPAGAIDRNNPYTEKAMFGGSMGSPAEMGYAASRKGQAGYMFGGGPDAAYGSLYDHNPGAAPGTDDFYAGASKKLSRHDRDIALSDPRAKAAAWEEGHKAAVNDVQTLRMKSPEELEKLGKGGNTLANAVRGTKREAYDQGESGKSGEHIMNVPPALAHPPLPPQQENTAPKQQPPATPRTAAVEQYDRETPDARPDYQKLINQTLFGRSSADGPVALSDENTKTGVKDFFGSMHEGESTRAHNHFGGKEQTENAPDAASQQREHNKFKAGNETEMADANRSMAPHSYEYKEQFTPAEQFKGERNVGPMANNMAADPVAKTAIVQDPKSGLLAIDKTKGLKLVMGGLADLQRQVDQMGARR